MLVLGWGLGHFCAIAVGISLGLLGGGGSILAVPILVYVMGVWAKGAIAISLVSVGAVSAMGAFLHWKKENVLVPALVLLTGIPIKQAVGTSLLIISLKSITGFLGYLGQTEIDWVLVTSFTLATCLGTLLGSYLNKLVNAKTLQAGFGYFVLFFAVLILYGQLFQPSPV